MAKILVTGGLGFIGHNVVALLERQGHSVAVIDNKTDYGIIPSNELAYLMQERRHKIRTNIIYDCDIADESGVGVAFTYFKPDIVIHLASFPRQKVVNANPMLGSRVMSEGLLNLLEASVKHKIKKFVYISSSMVYGNFKESYYEGINEGHDCNPQGQYAIMKLAGEWLVKDYQRQHNLNYTILRPSAVYGPYDVKDRVISQFFDAAIHGRPLQVNGAKESLDFTYISDCVDGIVAASTSDDTDNQIYNITRGRAHTLLEAAELVLKLVGYGTIEINERDDSFPRRGQLNNSSAYNDFGYTPTVNLEQGLNEYYDWLKSYFKLA